MLLSVNAGPVVRVAGGSCLLSQRALEFSRYAPSRAGPTRRTSITVASTQRSGKASVFFTDVADADTASVQKVSQLISIRFSTHFKAAFGEKLKVVGSHPTLGEWDVLMAPDMHWTEGHFWKASIELPVGEEVEFKVVHVHHGGVAWESCRNRYLKVAFEDDLPPGHRLTELDILVPWSDERMEVAAATALASLAAPKTATRRSEDSTQSEAWDLTNSGLPEDLTSELSASQRSSAVPTAEKPAKQSSSMGIFDAITSAFQLRPAARPASAAEPEPEPPAADASVRQIRQPNASTSNPANRIAVNGTAVNGTAVNGTALSGTVSTANQNATTERDGAVVSSIVQAPKVKILKKKVKRTPPRSTKPPIEKNPSANGYASNGVVLSVPPPALTRTPAGPPAEAPPSASGPAAPAKPLEETLVEEPQIEAVVEEEPKVLPASAVASAVAPTASTEDLGLFPPPTVSGKIVSRVFPAPSKPLDFPPDALSTSAQAQIPLPAATPVDLASSSIDQLLEVEALEAIAAEVITGPSAEPELLKPESELLEAAPAEDTVKLAESNAGDAAEKKAKKRSAEAQLIETAGKAAGLAAVGIAAGAVMSVLAVDISDVAITGAILAASSSLLL